MNRAKINIWNGKLIGLSQSQYIFISYSNPMWFFLILQRLLSLLTTTYWLLSKSSVCKLIRMLLNKHLQTEATILSSDRQQLTRKANFQAARWFRMVGVIRLLLYFLLPFKHCKPCTQHLQYLSQQLFEAFMYPGLQNDLKTIWTFSTELNVSCS